MVLIILIVFAIFDMLAYLGCRRGKQLNKKETCIYILSYIVMLTVFRLFSLQESNFTMHVLTVGVLLAEAAAALGLYFKLGKWVWHEARERKRGVYHIAAAMLLFGLITSRGVTTLRKALIIGSFLLPPLWDMIENMVLNDDK